MATLSSSDILALAEAKELEAPRVFMRKNLDGTVCFVLCHGPIKGRIEMTFDRRATASQVQAELERS